MKKLSTTEFILDLQNKFDKLTISLDKITEKNNNDLNNTIKEEILRRFDKNIRNRVYHKKRNQRHCGSEGYWLENRMGIIPNGNNEPDILGFEMKKNSNKITLGDFSASEYIFSNQKKYIKINVDFKITKEIFIQTFGEPNQEKNGRFSWSGKVIPKYGNWNNFGQKMIFNKNNDLLLLYNYEKDKRERKTNFLNCFKKEIICIAFWSKEKLKNNIENKFNNKGFFICNKKNDKYNSISFGNPFNFHYFVEQLKDNTIFFDSGMYEGNSRNYSHFRANKNFWNKLITETI